LISRASTRHGVFVAALLCLVGCGDDAVELDFSQRSTPPPAVSHDDSRLVVGVGAMIGPVETYESHAGLLRYLARAVHRRPQLVQRRTYEEMNRMLISGEVDVAFICTGAYIPIRDRVTLLAVPIFDGEPSYHSILIARDPSLRSLSSLRGHSFAFTDPLSQTGRLYPIYRLRRDLQTMPREFFSRTVYSGAHDESVHLVLDGQVDAAAVDEVVYRHLLGDHPEYAPRLHVLDRSPAFGAPPVVARAGLPDDVVQSLRAALLASSEAPEARRYLQDLGVDGFAETADYAFAIRVARDAQIGSGDAPEGTRAADVRAVP